MLAQFPNAQVFGGKQTLQVGPPNPQWALSKDPAKHVLPRQQPEHVAELQLKPESIGSQNELGQSNPPGHVPQFEPAKPHAKGDCPGKQLPLRQQPEQLPGPQKPESKPPLKRHVPLLQWKPAWQAKQLLPNAPH